MSERTGLTSASLRAVPTGESQGGRGGAVIIGESQGVGVGQLSLGSHKGGAEPRLYL